MNILEQREAEGMDAIRNGMGGLPRGGSGGGMSKLRKLAAAGEATTKAASKKGWGKWALGMEGLPEWVSPWLLIAAMQFAVNKVNESKDRGLQVEALRARGNASSPEGMLAQMMAPDLQAKSRMAREALMNQLGGVHGPSLASGESFVNG